MSEAPRENPNVQRAVSFFTQEGFSRLLALVRQKYVEQGQVGGQVVLEESTPQERREIASFLGKPAYPPGLLKLRLRDLDTALRQSGFACTLPELLAASFPASSLITRPQHRAARAAHHETFKTTLKELTAHLPSEGRGRTWLEDGVHGLTWLFSRAKNAEHGEQERQLTTIRYVARILDELPGREAPQRLALFAQRTSGDPHMLDPNRAAGRLLLLALHDLTEHSAPLPAQDREAELRLYADVGLQVDTISSSVAVFHLGGAVSMDSTPDPLLTAAGARVLLLPLRQILAWHSAWPATTNTYIIENPQVFEEMSDRLSNTQRPPTLICTAGWPSVAATALLDLLVVASPDHHFYYSGDFDLKGLQIAAHLLARYTERLSPWHIDPEAYMLALQAGGLAAPTGELAQLKTLPSLFAPVVSKMQEQGQWAYQEGITHLLTPAPDPL
ncbi:TIGR02679 family protein [Ktedonospora formicarum]|uniref:TIGR02679 family protein n=1 Tax=Ktedonospora formicarum TaxID=2778364 RepID=A0A8J3IBV5_9CHLR|nr:TIGR02679 family protein [Ktedonospora formicarum]GHO49807.1 hypothetical protein KSX_79700 [Ktedonospora formicarum]